MKNRALVIFISIFLAIVLIFGCVLGLITALKGAKAVVRYDGVVADAECVSYLAAYYKMQHIRSLRLMGIDARDTEAFWASESETGETYGELLRESFREYVSMLVAANSIYLSYSSYTADDKLTVSQTAEEILKYKANGSVATFNEKCEKYGFNYNDFCNAAALLYKSQRAEEIIYGADGKNLAGYPEECEKYFDTYSHVSLIFVRDEKLLERDADGNILYDELGNACLRDMTDEERAERENTVATLDAAIEAKRLGGDGQITPEMFEIFLAKTDGDVSMNETGYYFHASSETTAEFASEFPEVVERALSMSKYEYAKVECSIGVCYIYKYDNVADAYSDTENPFFSDFYADAADYLYLQTLRAFAGEVAFTDGFDEIDVVAIPVIEEFYIREWKSKK